MTFDPNAPLDDKAAHDAYVRWCAEQLSGLVEMIETRGDATHAATVGAAGWLWVASVAPMHLDQDCDRDREQHLTHLARMFTVARKTERAAEDVGLRDWLVARAVLDCYEGSSTWGDNLLDAARCAASSLILTEVHPLKDLGMVAAPDAWTLALRGYELLGDIDSEEPLGPYDFAVLPNQAFIDKMNWQKVNNTARQLGVPPFSPN